MTSKAAELAVVVVLLAVAVGFAMAAAPSSAPLGSAVVQSAEAHRNPSGIPVAEMKRINRDDPRVKAHCGNHSIWWPFCIWGVWAHRQTYAPVGNHGYHIRTWGWEGHLISGTREIHVTTRYIHNTYIRSRHYPF